MRIWLAAGFLVLAGLATLATPPAPPYRDLDALGLTLSALAALSLVWVRSAPLRAFVAACAVLVANAALGYPATLVHWPLWVALFACFALDRDVRWRIGCGALFAVALTGFFVLDREPGETLSGIAVGVFIATVGGDAVRSRRAAAEADRARLLLEERTRLARELHDALGHAVNVMVMQAAVGRRVQATDPGFGAEALRHIETLGRGALEELDQVIQALSPDGETPGMTDLAALADRVRAAGRALDLNVGAVDLTPDGARALHRIVQEAVTNALRHTDAGRIRLSLAQAGDRVRLEVLNEGRGFPSPEPGRGLANMRRRADAQGGEFHAGPVPGGFAVRVTLPAAP
ncbi:histidine kinase [Actinocorallia sp. API 0066]|uniref:sensor histidine kinase n=1 Tax=Actinocorallia sp. API 0066 TaxID=2896846 RepID=UPI001E5C2926|nr:histidine kinase [Actinocorallia sp. API 0066]MCD0449559.1 histidine kinase [Actinocorallia sp. API 0066]